MLMMQGRLRGEAQSFRRLVVQKIFVGVCRSNEPPPYPRTSRRPRASLISRQASVRRSASASSFSISKKTNDTPSHTQTTLPVAPLLRAVSCFHTFSPSCLLLHRSPPPPCLLHLHSSLRPAAAASCLHSSIRSAAATAAPSHRFLLAIPPCRSQQHGLPCSPSIAVVLRWEDSDSSSRAETLRRSRTSPSLLRFSHLSSVSCNTATSALPPCSCLAGFSVVHFMGFAAEGVTQTCAKLAMCSFCIIFMLAGEPVHCLGVNWGTQASHNLPPSIVVQLFQNNNIPNVKLFDSNEEVLKALAGTNLQVMVAIPNDLLQNMTDSQQATNWVQQNVVRYIFQGGVNIKYVAVGNEPFLKTYNGTFISSTFPALSNIQNALNSANLGDQIKATVPMNADVLTDAVLPSQGTFRPDILPQMTQIVQLLHQNNCPFTVNIYPFISLYNDPHFPIEYAFFDGSAVATQDGTKTYTNVFDASYDTLVAALASAGFPDTPIIVGEIGWPTDGNVFANSTNAQRFNQGFLNHVLSNGGTPSRPNTNIEFYLFSLLDEDQKSIAPGPFERHWGIFQFDGVVKYALSVSGSSGNSALQNAQGVQYLQQRWCVLADNADLSALDATVTYACSNSDCTSLGYGCSCNPYLDTKGNASYAFNQYFQMQNQGTGTCYFNGLGSITYNNPSENTCLFIVQIAETSATSRTSGIAAALASTTFSAFLLLLAVV